tara:strand:- start:54 stop:215 length:162 start_codon:yes stop_codon:yes gene_type:complete
VGVDLESTVSVFGVSDGLGVDVAFSLEFPVGVSEEAELFSDSRFLAPDELPLP